MIVYLFTTVTSLFFVPKRNLAVYANKQTEHFGRFVTGFATYDNNAKTNFAFFQHAFKSVTEKKRNSLIVILLAAALPSIIFGASLSASKNSQAFGLNAVYIPNQAPYLSFCSLRL